MTDHDASPPHDHAPGAPCPSGLPARPADDLLQTLADQLTAAGYDARSPAWHGRGYLKIMNAPGILSELTTDPGGHVTWECRAADPARVTAVQLTATFLALLHPYAAQPATVERRTDLAPVSLAGRALKANGLDVALDILDVSQTDYTTCTELRITNPAQPERGIASIAADGTTWWECRTHPALTLDGIADAIARALAAAAPSPG